MNASNTITKDNSTQVAKDKALMKVIQSNDMKEGEKALRAIIARYKEPIFFYAYKFFKGNRVTAEEMVQEVFIKVWEKRHLYNTELTFSTWMYNIAIHHMIDEKRKENNAVLNINNLTLDYSNANIESSGKSAFQIESNTLTPIQIIVKSERRKMMLDAIAMVFVGKKGEQEKQVFNLFYFSELNLNETSKELGIPLSTVKIILLRGKTKLRIYLSKSNRILA